MELLSLAISLSFSLCRLLVGPLNFYTEKKQKKARRPLNFCFKGLYSYKLVTAKTTASFG